MKKGKVTKKIMALMATGVMALSFAVTASAASESLNKGKATWAGGVSASDNLFSRVRDNKKDNLQYSVRVWVVNDKGNRKEKTGVTDGVGASGQVKTYVGATRENPLKANKCGYNDFEVISVK
ncbi:hypothetical protein [Exiguobacterium sp.]|uniref:hypothetical protein n=1 Tax=Exiguobacterium sp. TaxID=44751 RepID=UPI00289CE91B|nr:hypothetical protein [Exiguobacterium sp.]